MKVPLEVPKHDVEAEKADVGQNSEDEFVAPASAPRRACPKSKYSDGRALTAETRQAYLSSRCLAP